MTAEIVNLKRHRKRLVRGEGEAKAEENRRRFGQSKAEREGRKAEERRDLRHLDGHKRDS